VCGVLCLYGGDWLVDKADADVRNVNALADRIDVGGGNTNCEILGNMEG
jgi:peptidase E